MVTTYSQSAGGSETGMGPRYARGLYLGTNFSTVTISSATLYLRKNGSPTGSATLNLVDGSGTVIGSLGSILLQNLSSSLASVTFNSSSQDTDSSNCALVLSRDDGAQMLETVKIEYTTTPSPSSADKVNIANVSTSGDAPTNADSSLYPKCSFDYEGSTPGTSSGARLPPPPIVL